MLEKLRAAVFWGLDTLRGSQIKKAYDEIKKFYEMDSTSRELAEYHKNAFEETYKTCNHYHGVL